MAETVVVNGRPIGILSREQVQALRVDALTRYARDLHAALNITTAFPKHSEELVEDVVHRLEQLAGPPQPQEKHAPPREMLAVKGIPILTRSHMQMMRMERLQRTARDIKDVLLLSEPVPNHFEAIIDFILDKQRVLAPDGPVAPAQPDRRESLRNFSIMSRDKLTSLHRDALVRTSRHLYDALGLTMEDHPPTHKDDIIDWVLEKQNLLDQSRHLGAGDTGDNSAFYARNRGAHQYG